MYTVLHTIMRCAPIILILIWIVINKQIHLVVACFLFSLNGKRTTTKTTALLCWLWTLKQLSIGLLPESQFQFIWSEIEWIWNFYWVQTAPNTFHRPIIDNCMIIIVGLFGNLIRAWLRTNHYRCPKSTWLSYWKSSAEKKRIEVIPLLPWTMNWNCSSHKVIHSVRLSNRNHVKWGVILCCLKLKFYPYLNWLHSFSKKNPFWNYVRPFGITRPAQPIRSDYYHKNDIYVCYF